MNTSKQVNVMIGFLFLSFIAFGAYYAWEPSREAAATEEQMTTFAARGATLFVANCRTCHGLEGKGPEEGGVGPALNTPAFLLLDKDNAFGLPPTPVGEVTQIETFLTNTIACGRVNTFMPVWSQEHGGALQTIQIEYIVSLITQGRWDLVARIGHEHDEELGINAEEVVVKDLSALSVTTNNCGQYSSATASALRSRD
ncbi:MAG: c-type cytochrome, partial [Chloroflexi bacterium]|nr:c-type cytochrome [Chloroflexota bacterium]